jgi:hypothetical protein
MIVVFTIRTVIYAQYAVCHPLLPPLSLQHLYKLCSTHCTVYNYSVHSVNYKNIVHNIFGKLLFRQNKNKAVKSKTLTIQRRKLVPRILGT